MFQATVLSAAQLTPTLVLLKLKCLGGLAFKAGQFIVVHIPADPADPQSKPSKGYYSLASAEQDEDVDLLVEHRQGHASAWLCARKPGDQLECEGPLGKFGLAETQTRTQIFLGYHAGLAPLRSMILSLLRTDHPGHVHLFLAGHGQAELLFDAEWRALALKDLKFHYHPVLQPTADNPFLGKNQDPADELVKKMVHRGGHQIYLAGFNKEVEPMLPKLEAAGFDKDHIKVEKFG